MKIREWVETYKRNEEVPIVYIGHFFIPGGVGIETEFELQKQTMDFASWLVSKDYDLDPPISSERYSEYLTKSIEMIKDVIGSHEPTNIPHGSQGVIIDYLVKIWFYGTEIFQSAPIELVGSMKKDVGIISTYKSESNIEIVSLETLIKRIKELILNNQKPEYDDLTGIDTKDL